MTSTITKQTLTVTLTESVVLEDADLNEHAGTTVNTFTINEIARIVKRLVSVPNTEVGLLAFAADLSTPPIATVADTYAVGHFDQDFVRYLRITNKDDSTSVSLRFRCTSNAEYLVLLEAGQTYSYGCDSSTGTVNTMDADTGPAPALALDDLEDITAIASAGSVDLDVYIASI